MDCSLMAKSACNLLASSQRKKRIRKRTYTSAGAKRCRGLVVQPARLSGTLYYSITQDCGSVSGIQ
jgi:hypothetical protein